MEWQTGVVPIFKKGSNYQGITQLSLSQESLFQGGGQDASTDCNLTEPQIREEQYPLVYMCFVDLDKAYDCIPQSLLRGEL